MGITSTSAPINRITPLRFHSWWQKVGSVVAVRWKRRWTQLIWKAPCVLKASTASSNPSGRYMVSQYNVRRQPVFFWMSRFYCVANHWKIRPFKGLKGQGSKVQLFFPSLNKQPTDSNHSNPSPFQTSNKNKRSDWESFFCALIYSCHMFSSWKELFFCF